MNVQVMYYFSALDEINYMLVVYSKTWLPSPELASNVKLSTYCNVEEVLKLLKLCDYSHILRVAYTFCTQDIDELI